MNASRSYLVEEAQIHIGFDINGQNIFKCITKYFILELLTKSKYVAEVYLIVTCQYLNGNVQ